jgi:DNA-binding transcriptional LysR family regulator
VLKSIEVIMREVGNLKRIGEEFSMQDAGTLSIATTHSQARYFLPEPVAQLRKRFPKVNISLHQGSPEQVARMVIEEVADLGLATESLADREELVSLPCYEWRHVVVMPRVIRSRRPSGSRSRISRPGRWCPTTRRSAAARASTRRSPRASSSPTSCSRRSTRT